MAEHRDDQVPGDEEQFEYDNEGNIVGKAIKEIIDPLPAVDHAAISYSSFQRNFYMEAEDIKVLGEEQVGDLRKKLNVKVSGLEPVKPVTSFAHFGFDPPLMQCVRKSGFSVPTSIQCQGIPAILSGRDLIGIAKTGSGKTLAFIWPMIIHIIDQEPLKAEQGPIALIVCPTRELAQQTYKEAVLYGKPYHLRVVCAYGGGSMWEQQKACQSGAEVIVCTPGRLIDLIKKKSTNLRRVTFLVFDEADRLFDLGFEPQIRSIVNNIRPDRQALLFSATFKWKTEKLAREILVDPIRVLHGESTGEINQDIQQIVDLIPSEEGKWNWLKLRIVSLMSIGTVLIFVTRKQNCIDLASKLEIDYPDVCTLHGDLSQFERNTILSAFRARKYSVMVATDVAARGLDIPHIRTVINYDPARDIDTHTHRCGRTGRAGEKGTAYTLLTSKDKEFAGYLVRQLEATNQFVLKSVLELANKNQWFQNSRFKQTDAKKAGMGGIGQCIPISNPISELPEGCQATRFQSVKKAMMSQYRSKFVRASEPEERTMAYTSPKVEDNTPHVIKDGGTKIRKTRWDK